MKRQCWSRNKPCVKEAWQEWTYQLLGSSNSLTISRLSFSRSANPRRHSKTRNPNLRKRSSLWSVRKDSIQAGTTSPWACTSLAVSQSRNTMTATWCFPHAAASKTMLPKASLQMRNEAWLRAARLWWVSSRWIAISFICRSSFQMREPRLLVEDPCKGATRWSTSWSSRRIDQTKVEDST